MPRMGGYYPSEHKTTHQDGGRDEIDLEGLENKAKNIWLAVSASVLNLDDQTVTTDWTDLDLTAKTSANAKIAILELLVKLDSYTSGACQLQVRKNGTTPAYNVMIDKGDTAIGLDTLAMVLCGLDTGQVLEYRVRMTGTLQADFEIWLIGYID